MQLSRLGAIFVTQCRVQLCSRRKNHLASPSSLWHSMKRRYASNGLDAADAMLMGREPGGSSSWQAKPAVAEAHSCPPVPPPKPKQLAKYCKQCGGRVELSLRESGTRWRHVCADCGYIDYYNVGVGKKKLVTSMISY